MRDLEGFQPYRITADVGDGSHVLAGIFALVWYGGLAFAAVKSGIGFGTVGLAVVGLVPALLAFSGIRSSRWVDTRLEVLAPMTGRLLGVVHTTAPLPAESRFRLEIEVVDRRPGDTPDRVLWRTYGVAAPLPLGVGEEGGQIPVDLELPASAPAKDDDGGSHEWLLEVRSEAGVRGFFARFRIHPEFPATVASSDPPRGSPSLRPGQRLPD